MYSLFDLAGTKSARIAAFGSALALSAVLMATAIIPASPANPLISGVLV